MKVYNQGKEDMRFRSHAVVVRSSTGKFTFKNWLRRTWAYVWFMFKVNVAALFITAALIAIGGVWFSTHTTEAQVIEAPMVILDRIASCESGINGKAGTARQFDAKGNVVEHKNSNGTYDIGIFQINSIHLADAMQRGDNLFTEEGNTAYAKYLWENKGTGDWDSSSKCWRR